MEGMLNSAAAHFLIYSYYLFFSRRFAVPMPEMIHLTALPCQRPPWRASAISVLIIGQIAD